MSSFRVALVVDDNEVQQYVVDNAASADAAREVVHAHVLDVLHYDVGQVSDLDERTDPVYLDAEADGE